MNKSGIELVGDKELLAALADMDQKTQITRQRQILKESAKVLIKEEKLNIPRRKPGSKPRRGNSAKQRFKWYAWHPRGTAKRNVIQTPGRSRRTATIFVGPRDGGDVRDPAKDAFYFKWVNEGTKKLQGSHVIERSFYNVKHLIVDSEAKALRQVLERSWARKVKKGIV